MGVVEEEADESTFWLDILSATGNATAEEVDPLLKESRELTAIFTASSKTAKKNSFKKAEKKSRGWDASSNLNDSISQSPNPSRSEETKFPNGQKNPPAEP